MERIKTLFVTDNLGCGGAERVLVNLLNGIDKTRYNVALLTLSGNGVNKDRLNSDVEFLENKAITFKGMSKLIKLLPASLLYKFYIGKADYDVIIAYMHGLPAKVVSAYKGKKIAWIHCNMMGAHGSSIPKYYISRSSVSKHFGKYNAVVGVSQVACESFKEYTGISDNVYLCHNTNNVSKIIKDSAIDAKLPFDCNNSDFVFCSVGSLTPVKGYERLLHASKELMAQGYKFKVMIIGGGKLEQALKAEIELLGLENTVFLIGFQENPYKYVARSNAFICSSLSEGFSTAVSEAIILEKPCISTLVSGAKEILGENNEYGLVVENSERGVYEGMKLFLDDKETVNKFSAAAKKRSNFFSPESTIGDVERIIDSVVNSR